MGKLKPLDGMAEDVGIGDYIEVRLSEGGGVSGYRMQVSPFGDNLVLLSQCSPYNEGRLVGVAGKHQRYYGVLKRGGNFVLGVVDGKANFKEVKGVKLTVYEVTRRTRWSKEGVALQLIVADSNEITPLGRILRASFGGDRR